MTTKTQKTEAAEQGNFEKLIALARAIHEERKTEDNDYDLSDTEALAYAAYEAGRHDHQKELESKKI